MRTVWRTMVGSVGTGIHASFQCKHANCTCLLHVSRLSCKLVYFLVGAGVPGWPPIFSRSCAGTRVTCAANNWRTMPIDTVASICVCGLTCWLTRWPPGLLACWLTSTTGWKSFLYPNLAQQLAEKAGAQSHRSTDLGNAAPDTFLQ